MSKSEANSSDIKKQRHLYGCYGAITLCIMALLNISSHGWLKASVIGYLFGIFAYWIVSLIKQSPAIDQPRVNPIRDVTEDQSQIPIAEPTVKIDETQTLSPEQHLLQNFARLHQSIAHILPVQANDKFLDIQGLLVVITQKFQRAQNPHTQTEILKIQRIINNYIAPLVSHYQELPIIFHDRKIADELSPNELLIQQLELIHEEMLKVTEHVFRDDLEALIQHGEFLQHKLNPPDFFKAQTNIEKIS
jgi:hypothetical protein